MLWKIAWIVFSIAVIVYTGYLLNDIITEEVQFSYLNHGLKILNSVILISVSILYLRIVFNSYNSIKWDSESLHLRFKKRCDSRTFHRSEIEFVDLKLNDLHIKKENGEELYFDVTDMYLSYSEINRFRKDFPVH